MKEEPAKERPRKQDGNEAFSVAIGCTDKKTDDFIKGNA